MQQMRYFALTYSFYSDRFRAELNDSVQLHTSDTYTAHAPLTGTKFVKDSGLAAPSFPFYLNPSAASLERIPF